MGRPPFAFVEPPFLRDWFRVGSATEVPSMRIRFLSLLLLASVVAVAGCSISDSISSPFKSSSASSRSSESNQTKFHDSVVDYTASFAAGQGDFNVFQRGLSDLAAKYGQTNWESDPETYVSVGKGLRKAKVDTGTLQAYIVNVAKGDAMKAAAIQKGYGGN